MQDGATPHTAQQNFRRFTSKESTLKEIERRQQLVQLYFKKRLADSEIKKLIEELEFQQKMTEFKHERRLIELEDAEETLKWDHEDVVTIRARQEETSSTRNVEQRLSSWGAAFQAGLSYHTNPTRTS